MHWKAVFIDLPSPWLVWRVTSNSQNPAINELYTHGEGSAVAIPESIVYAWSKCMRPRRGADTWSLGSVILQRTTFLAPRSSREGRSDDGLWQVRR